MDSKNKLSYGLYNEDYTHIGITRLIEPDNLVIVTIIRQDSENESTTVSIKFPFMELKRVVDLLSIANDK